MGGGEEEVAPREDPFEPPRKRRTGFVGRVIEEEANWVVVAEAEEEEGTRKARWMTASSSIDMWDPEEIIDGEREVTREVPVAAVMTESRESRLEARVEL